MLRRSVSVLVVLGSLGLSGASGVAAQELPAGRDVVLPYPDAGKIVGAADGKWEEPRTDAPVPGASKDPGKPPAAGKDVKPVETPSEALERETAATIAKRQSERDPAVVQSRVGPFTEVSDVTKVNKDGSFVVSVAPGRINFEDVDGKFNKIDMKVVKGPDGVVRTTGDSYVYEFGSFPSEFVKVTAPSGEQVLVRPDSQAKVAPVVASDGLSVTYPNVFPNVDVKYTVSGAGLKEDIVMKGPQTRSEFPFVVRAEGELREKAPLKDRPVAPGTLELGRGDGLAGGFAIPPAVVTDRAGQPIGREVAGGRFEVRGSKPVSLPVVAARDGDLKAGEPRLGQRPGLETAFVAAVSPEWLAGLGAEEFPVSLDPTITQQEYMFNSVSMIQQAGNIDTYCVLSQCNPIVGRDNLVPSPLNFRSHVWFETSAIFDLLDELPYLSTSVTATLKAVNVGSNPGYTNEWYVNHQVPVNSGFDYDAFNSMPYAGQGSITGISTPTGMTIPSHVGGYGDINFSAAFAVWQSQNNSSGGVLDPDVSIAIAANEFSPPNRMYLNTLRLDMVIPNLAPQIASVSTSPPSPVIGVRHLSATTVASDPDGDPLEYQFTICDSFAGTNNIDGSTCVVSGWSSSSTFADLASLKTLQWGKTYHWFSEVRDGITSAWSAPPPFSVDMPPSTVSSFRGGSDEFSGMDGGVNLVTGNYFASQTDVSVATVGPELGVSRSYNSLDTRVGLFGKGWSSTLDMRLENFGTPTPLGKQVVWPDGSVDFFGDNSALGNLSGPFASPLGSGDELTVPLGVYTLTQVDGTAYAFNAAGRLASITDDRGRKVEVTWSGNAPTTMKSLVSTGLAAPRTLTFTSVVSGPNSLITSVKTDSVTGQGQLTWTYGYTGTNLISVNDAQYPAPSAAKTIYEYNGAGGRLSKWKNPLGNTEVELQYDAAAKVEWRKNGEGNQHLYWYTAPVPAGATSATMVTDPRSLTTVWGFDNANRLVRRVNEESKTRSWNYNVNGFLELVIYEDDAAGAPHRDTYTTDFATGQVTLEAAQENGNTDRSKFTYVSKKLESATDPTGIDALGNVLAGRTTLITYVASGAMAGKAPATEDPPGPTKPTTYTWSIGTETASGGGFVPPGLMLTKTVPVAGSGASMTYGMTTYTYNKFGDLITMLDHKGLTSTYTYDEIGRQKTQTDTGTGVPAGVVTTKTFDKLSRVTSVLEPAVTNIVTATARQKRTDTVFDANGNVTDVSEVAVSGGGTTRTTHYTFDLADRQKTETAGYGTALATTSTVEYDPNGNVKASIDGLGRRYETTFTPLNRPDVTILKAYQPDVWFTPATVYDLTITDVDYDPLGRETATTDSEGRKIVTTYVNDQVAARTLKNFVPRDGSAAYDINLETNTYDAAGRLLSRGEGNLVGGNFARKTTYVYDVLGRKTQERLWNSSNVLEQYTQYSYDDAGHQIKVVQSGMGSVADRETRSVYGISGTGTGQLVSTEVENGAGASDDLITTMAYDARGLATSTTDPSGVLTTTAFDQMGRPTTSMLPSVQTETGGGTPVAAQPTTFTGYDAFGGGTHAKDPNGNTTTTAFDVLGREITITHPSYTPPGGTAVVPTENRTYDLVGNMVGSQDRRGKWSYYDFDKLNRNTRTRTPGNTAGTFATSYTLFDKVGNTIKTIDPIGAVKQTQYDMMNHPRVNITEIRQPTPHNAYMEFDYDTLGRQTWIRDHFWSVTTQTFNASGQVLTTTDPYLKTTTNVVSAFGQPMAVIDPTNRWTKQTFDQAGRQLTGTLAGIGGTQTPLTTAFTYDKAGRKLTETSPMGDVVKTEYNAAGRMFKVTTGFGTADAAVTQSFHDKAGNTTRIKNGRLFDTIMTYQSWNLPQDRIEPEAVVAQPVANRTWTTSYDSAGNVIKEAQPGGVSVAKTFDEAGRVASEVATGAAGSRSFTYDLAGRPVTVSHPTATINVAYEDRGMPINVTGGNSTTSYVWDERGALTARTDTAGTASFSYIPLGGLKLQTVSDPVTGKVAKYDFDDAGRLGWAAYMPNAASPVADQQTRLVNYDTYGRQNVDALYTAPSAPGGQILSYQRQSVFNNNSQLQSETLAGPHAGVEVGTQSYTYNRRGEMKTWTNQANVSTNYTYDLAGNRTGAGAASFTYDPQNRLTAGGGKTYSWSDRGTMLSSTITATSAVTSMVFDAFNQNLSSTSVAAGTTTMVYDGLGRISTRNSVQFKYAGVGIDPISDGTWTSAQNPTGQVHATKNNTAGTARWAFANTHDDLGAWINPAGTGVDNTVGYDPYGQVTGRTGALAPTGGFQGDWTDPTTDEVWMGARHYTPGTATFTSRDTYAGQLATPISLNRYTYAHGNPLNMIDPDGHAAAANQSQESYMAEVLGKIATDRDNNYRWYHTIAQNNGATDDMWNQWWATYLSTVLEPSYMALINAADAYWHSQNKPVAVASGGGGGVQNIAPGTGTKTKAAKKIVKPPVPQIAKPPASSNDEKWTRDVWTKWCAKWGSTACAIALVNAEKAKNGAERIAKVHADEGTALFEQFHNALQHAIWTGMNTYWLGVSAAREMGNLYDPDDSNLESKKDRRNNEIGYKHGKQAWYWESVVDAVEQSFVKGELSCLNASGSAVIKCSPK